MGGQSATYQETVLSLRLPTDVEVWALQNSQDPALDAYVALPTDTAAQKIMDYFYLQQTHQARLPIRVGRMFVLGVEVLANLLSIVPLVLSCVSRHFDQWETILFAVVTGVCLCLIAPLKTTSLWFPRMWNNWAVRIVLALLCLISYALVVGVNDPNAFDERSAGGLGVGLMCLLLIVDGGQNNNSPLKPSRTKSTQTAQYNFEL
ncbi:hypothetical protein PROFUN_16111 [Planoprotostelium fungivorum]|uniref:Uncharacterized protein n=1 Tax=Planoprotostelium fungivorum TaxID=1890364 RepID=A0A2P6MT62_9EUKA|nr:hypothetical protein PROFUN_16111 [Planoprotostelium fungivorum]